MAFNVVAPGAARFGQRLDEDVADFEVPQNHLSSRRVAAVPRQGRPGRCAGGPAKPCPGPTLPMVAATAETAVVKSSPMKFKAVVAKKKK